MTTQSVLVTCNSVLLLILLLGCNAPENKFGTTPQVVTIAGKIDHYDPSLAVNLSIKRLGLTQDDVVAKADSLGNFMATFESYIPLDIVIGYRTNFWILLQPGDSLFVHFDGECKERPELLKTIRFGGDRAKTNQYAAKYQELYFANELYADFEREQKAVKEYDSDRYLQYLDTLKQKNTTIYERFVTENRPNRESRKWALLFSESKYYNYLAWYASDHRDAHSMGWDNDWDVPKGFYNRLNDRLPIEPEMFISTYALNAFTTAYRKYVIDNLRGREEKHIDQESGKEYYTWRVLPGGAVIAPRDISDSIKVYSTVELVRDSLLRQIMLTEIFDKQFENQNIAVFEQYRDVADEYIKEPFLKEPLLQKYLQTKSRIENPQLYTESILRKSTDYSVNQIVSEILKQNEGKIIYVDFWATWCGPCLAEMPNSKVLEQELKDEDVSFIYVCLDSDEKQWKATLDKYQLGGQHYFLSTIQSNEIRALLGMPGIPFYLVIDKDGVIKEKGNHLRPMQAKNEILKLLKNK